MKERKNLLINLGLAIVAGLLVGLAAVFLTSKKPSGLTSPIPMPTSSQLISKEPEKLAKYEDEAGFSFEYPEGLMVKDVSGEEDVYSLLEISSAQHQGKTLIKVVDASDSQTSDAGPSREISLGGMAGKQVQLENPRRLVTVAIAEGVMFSIISPLDQTTGAFWNKVHNAIVASFQLNEKQAETSKTEEVIYEEEEVIE